MKWLHQAVNGIYMEDGTLNGRVRLRKSTGLRETLGRIFTMVHEVEMSSRKSLRIFANTFLTKEVGP